MPQHRTIPITPIQLPRGLRGIVVFGGSFDPPHLWHTHIASAARRRAFGTGSGRDGGAIVFVPTFRSPFKSRGPSASDADRIAMLRLATRRLTGAVVWTDEIDRAAATASPESSYTIDTLVRLRRLLRRQSPGMPITLRLLIGSDQAASFHRWREARRVLRIAEPLVALRPPHHTRDDLRRELERTGAWSEPQIAAWLSRIVPTGIRGHSSTAVRAGMSARPRAGSSSRANIVSTPVRNYIAKNGLYRDAHRASPRQVVRPRNVGV
ncbi:MAG: nicotinate-nicotinamide nucleotide adenylyltransferase [Phycisphaerales bacterium]|nr:nicotinate-nicotinamide nucleotide adenylyltransferase [Phycisphaerales bacterium]